MADPLLTTMLADAAALRAATSVSPTAVSPSSVTPRTGGLVGFSGSDFGFSGSGTTSSKLFSVVKISFRLEGSARVCFGKIGAGGTFCIRRDCAVKSHLETKIPFGSTDMDYVFICQVVGASAFVEPVVSEGQIPASVWAEWEDKTLGLADWRREFQAVEATDDKFASSEDVQKEAQFLGTAATFRTPGKRKRDLDEKGPTKNLGRVKFEKYVRDLPEEPEELEKIVQYGMKKGTITTIVSRLETHMGQMDDGLEEVANLSVTRFCDNEETLELLSGLVVNVRSGIGTPIELAPKFMSPTMWGTMSFMADEVLRVGTLVHKLTGVVNPFQLSTTQELLGIKTNGDMLAQVVTSLMGTVAQLTTDNTSVRAAIADLVRQASVREQRGARTSAANHHEEMVDRFSAMQTEVTVEASVDRPVNRRNASESVTTEDVQGAIRPGDLIDYPILTRDSYMKLCKVVDDVGLLKMSAEATAVKFGNLGIRNLKECTRWMEEFYVEGKYGLIIDPLTLLDRLFGDDAVDPITQLKTMDTMSKLNIDTGGESSALTSLKHARPRMFHTGRPMMICDQKTSRLNLLCKPLKWKSGTDGIRNHIIERMNVLQPHIRDDIDYEFGRNSERDTKAQMIATLSLTASVTFITQLLNYVDTLYEKLHIYSKFTSETAWSLSMQVLDRILADLYSPKEGASNGMKGDRKSICSHVLWASFKTLDVAQVYVDANFVNHPAISSEFIKFLATNSGSEKTEQLAATVTLVKNSLAGCVTDARTASSKSDTATTRVAELTATVTSLAARVRTLES